MLQQNIKTRDISAIGLCIWLVMLGHILEHIASPATNIMGWCVYSFHSALFVMCAGKTLRFSPWWSLGLYALSLVTPTWWIGAPALYMLTIPLLQKVPHGKRWIVLVCSIIAGLLSGFCPDPHGIAATLHLTRAVTFFPFFVIGVYQCTERPCKLRHVIQILSAIALVVGGVIAAWRPLPFLMSMTYNANSTLNTFVWRVAAYCITGGMVYTIWSLLPNNRVKCLTRIGETALPVYVLHNYVATIAVALSIALGKLITVPVAAICITTITIGVLSIIAHAIWKVLTKRGVSK